MGADLILGIETSCDETAVAVVEGGRRIVSNVVASQIDIHARYGGIVPEVASREHVMTMLPVVEKALADAGGGRGDLAGVAVTHGPGLAGSLLVGVNTAKALAYAWDLPLVGVNHLEAHIYANWLYGTGEEPPPAPAFPLLCLIVSGGHTDLVLMTDHGRYERLGRTRDDAAGEAFDKVARILGLGFPGGPAIQRVAAEGDAEAFALPRAWLGESLDFSFSGLKTAMLRLVAGDKGTRGWEDRERGVADLAASFQAAVVEVLVEKTRWAAERTGVGLVLLAGGVAANGPLRARMAEALPVPVRYARPAFCTDNAAMVGACGYFRLARGGVSGLDLDVEPNLAIV
jgi:N6-L-threonylcarbamoyladenine synthase